MPTGKSLGLKKGDFVYTGAFPGIIISDVHTFAPYCEVWGFEQEMGSCYATDLRKLTYQQFRAAINGPLNPQAEVSKKAIQEAEAQATV